MKEIHWNSDNEFELEGVQFTLTLSDFESYKTSPTRVVFVKNRFAIELYQKALSGNEPRNVLEFGVFEGGSAIFLSLMYELKKFVGIELKPEVRGLEQFLESHPVGERISVHYGVSQDDAEAVRRIVKNDFGDEPIDLIIDDASHQYLPTRRSFEIAFPLLRPGGVYVVEDWGWAHWPSFDKWHEKPAMSNLIFQLVMSCASSPHLIRDIAIFPAFAFITKSQAAQTRGEIDVDDLYQARGRRLNII